MGSHYQQALQYDLFPNLIHQYVLFFLVLVVEEGFPIELVVYFLRVESESNTNLHNLNSNCSGFYLVIL